MMAESAVYSRPVGFAEAVRKAGDDWRWHGAQFAQRLGDARLNRAFILAAGLNSADWQDGWLMVLRTKYGMREVF